MAFSISNVHLRSLPLPLLVTIITQVVLWLKGLTITNSLWAFIASLAIFLLSYLLTYLNTVENQQATAVVTVSSTSPSVQAVVKNAEAAPAPVAISASAPPASSSPPAPTFTLDSNNKTPTVGTNFTLSLDHGTPNGTAQIFEDENNQPLTAVVQLDAQGHGQIDFTPLNTLAPIGALLSWGGPLNIYAKDSAGRHKREHHTWLMNMADEASNIKDPKEKPEGESEEEGGDEDSED